MNACRGRPSRATGSLSGNVLGTAQKICESSLTFSRTSRDTQLCFEVCELISCSRLSTEQRCCLRLGSATRHQFLEFGRQLSPYAQSFWSCPIGRKTLRF